MFWRKTREPGRAIGDLTAFIDEGSEMNAHSLPLVKMPNRDGFINAWRPRSGD